MTKTPDAPDASGGRPPDQPPKPQRLFPSATKAGARVASVDSVGGSIDEVSLDLALSVLGTTYDEQEVRERLSSTLVHGVHALQRARSAGWYTTYEFEEELLKLFTQSAAAAALTSTTPSPADRTSGDLGALVAPATAGVTEFLCDPSPISPRVVLGAQVPTNFHDCPPRRPGPGAGGRDDRDASGRPYYAGGPTMLQRCNLGEIFVRDHQVYLV